MSDLSNIEIAVLRGLVATRPERKYGKTVKFLARAHGIGRSVGAGVVFEPSDFIKAADMLTARGIPSEAPKGEFTRAEAQPGVSEKAGARAVGADFVAIVPLNAGQVLADARFFVADGPLLDLHGYEAILLVENLEPFSPTQLASYQWIERDFVRGRPTLAVWRGGTGVLGTAAPAALVRRAGLPVLGFFDFDPKGLTFAAGGPRVEQLCLPPWEEFEAAARYYRREDLWFMQLESSRTQLDSLTAGPVFDAWQRMKRLRCGLPQENFPRGCTRRPPAGCL